MLIESKSEIAKKPDVTIHSTFLSIVVYYNF